MFLTVGPLIVCTYIIYLPDILSVRDPRKHLTTLMNSNYLEKNLNARKFLVCAFNLRSSKLDANTRYLS